MKIIVRFLMIFGGMLAVTAQAQTVRPGYKAKGFSGNPVFEGWYADPEGIIYGDEYWIFPTWSDEWGIPLGTPDLSEYQKDLQKNTINSQYLKQTFLDAFSSKDLVNWTKHSKVLDIKDISWAAYSIWAPSVIHTNNKYYLFFGANDIQSDSQPGGIGVAVSDKPEGPYRDALGKPLISSFHNGAQPIDQFVFRDDDGQYYLYYGGWRHCNIVQLKFAPGDLSPEPCDLSPEPCALSLEPFPDGETFKEITPENYVEGPFVFKRNGKYYFMWSEGGWTGPNYSVAYAIGDSPTGPFTRISKILQQNPEVATGAGHHSVIRIPGTDDYYIIYHRRPLGDTNGNHREVCIDRMYFNEDGTIKPVEITFRGVERRTLSLDPEEISPISPDSDSAADKLVVLWTSGDPDVPEKMVFMYTHAAKRAGWFKEVTLVIWGPSAKLIAENSMLQEKIKAMQKDGIVIEACVACANMYGVAESLRKLGVDVKGMGKPLTEYLKSGNKILTL